MIDNPGKLPAAAADKYGIRVRQQLQPRRGFAVNDRIIGAEFPPVRFHVRQIYLILLQCVYLAQPGHPRTLRRNRPGTGADIPDHRILGQIQLG
ncbi:hypothetical protein D3C73_1396300 [compost metagenome]